MPEISPLYCDISLRELVGIAFFENRNLINRGLFLGAVCLITAGSVA